MKTSSTVCQRSLVLSRLRLTDYAALTRPRMQIMVLFTVVVGALLSTGGAPAWGLLVHTLLGTACVAAGASALNQFLERDSDALMRRTEYRPLPTGRLLPLEALLFGLFLGLAGIAYLLLVLPHPAAALLAGFALFSYVGLYTPLKRVTTLNTLIGAISGAIPPLIGWSAMRGELDAEAVTLFGLLFIWQVPHFLAIAWIYREDYAHAGLQMMSVVDPTGRHSGWHMMSYCLALIPVSLLPCWFGQAGPIYLIGAFLLGTGFLAAAVAFVLQVSISRAWLVMRASLVYLPTILALMLLGR